MTFKAFNVTVAFRRPKHPMQAWFQITSDNRKVPLKLRVSFMIGRFGVHCNVPYIAERWGYIEPACGNGYVYHGWMGSHYSL